MLKWLGRNEQITIAKYEGWFDMVWRDPSLAEQKSEHLSPVVVLVWWNVSPSSTRTCMHKHMVIGNMINRTLSHKRECNHGWLPSPHITTAYNPNAADLSWLSVPLGLSKGKSITHINCTVLVTVHNFVADTGSHVPSLLDYPWRSEVQWWYLKVNTDHNIKHVTW